jgi:hypothetical protein
MSTETGAVVASLAGAVVTSLASLDFDWLSQLVAPSANSRNIATFPAAIIVLIFMVLIFMVVVYRKYKSRLCI